MNFFKMLMQTVADVLACSSFDANVVGFVEYGMFPLGKE